MSRGTTGKLFSRLRWKAFYEMHDVVTMDVIERGETDWTTEDAARLQAQKWDMPWVCKAWCEGHVVWGTD